MLEWCASNRLVVLYSSRSKAPIARITAGMEAHQLPLLNGVHATGRLFALIPLQSPDCLSCSRHGSTIRTFILHGMDAWDDCEHQKHA